MVAQLADALAYFNSLDPQASIDELTAYKHRTNPVAFCRDVLGHDPWSTPEAIMHAVAKPNASVAVKACHASSKTFTAAEIVLWWVYAMDGLAISTAPTGTQVKELLWGEIHKAHEHPLRPLDGALNQTELRRHPGVYALGRSTDQGVRFQGFHGERILIVIDEAPGVSDEIVDAIEGIRAGGDVRVLKLGNPMLASGHFHAAFTSERDDWQTFTISAFDTPNLEGLTLDDLLAMDDDELDRNPRPYLITRRWVKGRHKAWGPASPLWQAKVLGIFPSQSEDALFSLAWLERAKGQDPDIIDTKAPVVGGLDVAGPGEDETVLVLRQGPHVVGIETWSEPDPRGQVVAALRRWTVKQVNVDSVGLGYYMARHLADQDFTVVDINVGEAASDREKYANLKAELYWALRLRAEEGDMLGIDDDLTISQLAGIRYAHNARGQVVIESKDAARKRGVKSPDRAEAVMLAFATVATGLPVLVW